MNPVCCTYNLKFTTLKKVSPKFDGSIYRDYSYATVLTPFSHKPILELFRDFIIRKIIKVILSVDLTTVHK